MKKIVALAVIFLLVFEPFVWAATVENIRWMESNDEKLIIYYDIPGKGTFTVSISVSLDGGKTFDIIPFAISGAIGMGIQAGVSKEIEWDVFNDLKQLSGEMVVRIEAHQEPGKPVNKWLVLAGIMLTGGAIAGISSAGSTKVSTSENLPVITQYGNVMIEVTFPE